MSRDDSARAPRIVRRAAGQARVLRIIAGHWRGRKWRFPPSTIRPTPDRVRETLFNWLGPRVVGARCLDLFAGSGALGLEALSRGAAHVTFVEHDPVAAQALQTLLSQWQPFGAELQVRDAQRFLGAAPRAAAYDLVFLDPPFDSPLLPEVAGQLAAPGWLSAQARVYVECRAADGLPPLPAAWQLLKEGRAGEVGYYLYQ